MKNAYQVLTGFVRTVNVTNHVTKCEGWRPPFPVPLTNLKSSIIEGGEMGRDAYFDDFLALGFGRGLKSFQITDYYNVAYRYRRRLLNPQNEKGLVMMTEHPLAGPVGSGEDTDLFALVLVVEKRPLLLDMHRSEIDVIVVDTIIARPTRLLSWHNYDFVFKGVPKK